MKINIPAPVSVGLFLSYKCNASCRHCMYACSPRWPGDWISKSDLEDILKTLAVYVEPAPDGSDSVTVSHGLHFTGGEPFLNYSLLCRGVMLAEKYEIPSTFVETNCFWATTDQATRAKLRNLKKLGLKGIMISVNPFYLEFVPFERTRRCIDISLEIFGQNTMIYQMDFFRHFNQLGITGCLPLQDYLKLQGSREIFQYTEFFMMGRAVYQAHLLPERFTAVFPASTFFNHPCDPPFLRSWHNHVDNYGNYIPGFCGGLSLGNIKNLTQLVRDGIDLDNYPLLRFIIENDFEGFYSFACQKGYAGEDQRYHSKCHLCLDLRKFLVTRDSYAELKPHQFYDLLDLQ